MRQYVAAPERLIELVTANPKSKHIVVDEIQKLPELLEVVHLLIERKTGAQFILTGSSARKLRRQGVNLLGGRAVQKHAPLHGRGARLSIQARYSTATGRVTQ